MDYQDIWTLSEQEHGVIKPVSFELLKRGRELADKCKDNLVAIIFGNDFSKSELNKLIYYGADQVISVEHPALGEFLPEPYVSILCNLISKYRPEILIASATTIGRTVAPAVAVKCHTGLTADCTELDIDLETRNLIQTRPAIGGNILATIKTPYHRPQMATVRPHSNKPLIPDYSREGKIIKEIVEPKLLISRIKRISFRENSKESSNIQDAEIIIAGGKGFKKKENFRDVVEIAGLLKGAIGATRDIVDLGWISYSHQIGLSGKTVSPKLYFAIGISGSIQHLAGIKTAENIIAINNDPNAQILQIADYGIVGDLFEIIPILKEKLVKMLREKK